MFNLFSRCPVAMCSLDATWCGADLAFLFFCVLQVRQVKEKISQEKPDYGAERMKVIYSGT
jgi:hypothetical protein